MAEITQEVYQDNGFELVVYLQRKADPFKKCPECGRPLTPVASIYDEWQESNSSLIEYDYCGKCNHILQLNTRQRVGSAKTTNQQFHHMPPHEMVVQLLAHARHIQGRGITRLSVNRKWWQAWRYPLVMGDQLGSRMPRVRATGEPQSNPHHLQDEQALHTVPLPRYEPRNQPRRNPFTSRRTGGEDENFPEENTTSSLDEVAAELDERDDVTDQEA